MIFTGPRIAHQPAVKTRTACALPAPHLSGQALRLAPEGAIGIKNDGAYCNINQ